MNTHIRPRTSAGQVSEASLPAENAAQAINRAWHRLTGSPPAPGVSFDAAGGDSLGLMEIVFILERALETKLPLERFHGGQTAREFAEAALDCVFGVRSAAPQPQTPIFLCPAAHGDTPYLADFRRSGGGDVRFVTVRYPDLCDSVAAGFGLRALVDAVRAEVRAQMPTGPVHLAGYSLGGLIAYEAAVALEAEGREVSFLGILDAPAPGAHGPVYVRGDAPPDRLRACWWAIRRFAVARRDVRIRWLGRIAAFSLAVRWAAPLRRWLARRPALPPTPSGPASLSGWTNYNLAELLRGAACRQAIAYDRRTGPKLRAPVVLFRCDGWRADAEPDFGWARVAESVTIVPVPGDHYSTMTPPHVASTAAAFVAAQAAVRRM